MRGLGIFNICYGTVGLLSCLIVLLLEERFPREALVAGGLASAWMVATGIAMVIWGRRLTAFLLRTAKNAFDTLRTAARVTRRTIPTPTSSEEDRTR